MSLECGSCTAYPPSFLEHSKGLLASLAAVCLGDVFVFRVFGPSQAGARWFLMHSVVNIIIATLCLPDIVEVLSSPVCSLCAPMISWWPCYLAIAVHTYHAIAFNLKPEEVRHHVIFVLIGGAIALSLPWGPLMNFATFCVTGLPGGIDYALLVAVKTGRMPRLREKAINRWLNTWVRLPGLVWAPAISWACWRHGQTPALPSPILLISSVLCTANGLFYGEQVIGSFHRATADAHAATKPARTE